MARIEVTATVPLPIETVWKAHEDVRILEQIYPPYPVSRLKEPDIVCQTGTRFTVQLEWLPGLLYQDWVVEIVRWEPPTCFEDRQIEGPFQAWQHTHEFVAISAQETRLVDTVQFEFNPVLDELIIRPALELMFYVRTENLKRLLLQQSS